jgi:hypothetical protein
MINYHKQKYKIITNKNNLRPYAIYVNTGAGFSQQISKSYFYYGAAVNCLKKLNGAYFNTDKIYTQFDKYKKH